MDADADVFDPFPSMLFFPQDFPWVSAYGDDLIALVLEEFDYQVESELRRRWSDENRQLIEKALMRVSAKLKASGIGKRATLAKRQILRPRIEHLAEEG